MKLKRLNVSNFRCFRDELTIDFDDFTTLMGKNDSGKSTILEALDLFLNDNDPDKDDASQNGEKNDLTIACEFSDLPEELVIDDASPTTLAGEFMLNAAGNLEIRKKYSGSLQKPKCTNVEAVAHHPSAQGVTDLLQLKNGQLRARAAALGVDTNGVDLNINAKIRSRIREHVGNLELVLRTVPLQQDNGKRIWDELRKCLPLYSLFKSDRASSDQDPDAQDPLKIAVREALKEKATELDEIGEFVRLEVKKITDSTLKKLREMDSSLASQLNPSFAAFKWDTLFKASITSDSDIPINKRGSGVKRLILLNFFRAKCEQLALSSGRANIIYAVEEPETSQHPNNQRMLLRALSDLSTEAQVIISTHTPMLARSIPEQSLRFIDVRPDNRREILLGCEETNTKVAAALGILPDNSVKLFIGVEGPTDMLFLRELTCALRSEGQTIPDLEKLEIEGKIIFIPLGGSTLAFWTSRLANLNRPEFHLCDRDVAPPMPPKYEAHVTLVNQRLNCRARSTRKKEVENYLHKDAIIAAYSEIGIAINIPTNFNDFDDVPNQVARLVHEASGSPKTWDQLSDEEVRRKKSKTKKTLCGRAPQHMTLDRLSEIDPDGDLLAWIADIRDLLAL
jgi:putative ATP-dependent endonuclease of OLD family